MEGGLHSAAAYSALENRAYGSCVANGESFVVEPGTGMNLDISTGDGLISFDDDSAKRIQTTAVESVAVSAASSSFDRIDTVVAYIDTAVLPTTEVVDNINDILMFACVPGTASGSPTPPSGATIQSAIGAGNPYMELYDVLVPEDAVNTTGVTLTDRRRVLNILDIENIEDYSIPPSKLNNPYKFFARRATAFNFSNGSFGKINFDTEVFDPNGDFASGEYTAPVDGYYQFNWRASTSSGSGTPRVVTLLEIAGSARARGSDVSAPFAGSSGSTIAYMTAGQVARITALTTTSSLAADVSDAATCYFNGYLITEDE